MYTYSRKREPITKLCKLRGQMLYTTVGRGSVGPGGWEEEEEGRVGT